MICTKCSKKLEYNTSVCKYCKEPVALEGYSSLNSVSSVRTASDASVLKSSASINSEKKKTLIVMVCGALSALLVICILAALIIPRLGNTRAVLTDEPRKSSENAVPFSTYKEDSESKVEKSHKSVGSEVDGKTKKAGK